MEIMVALVICALAMSAILLSVQRHIHNSEQLNYRNQAHWVASHQLRAIQLGLIEVPQAPYQYRTQLAMFVQTWQVVAQQRALANNEVARISVQVSSLQQADKSYTLEGYQLIDATL